MDVTFEPVLRVDDYYDGVREGVALRGGVPHHFVWLGWESAAWEPGEDRYRLTPVPPAAGPAMVARGAFRNSATAPDPECPPLVPQEVAWTPVTEAPAGGAR